MPTDDVDLRFLVLDDEAVFRRFVTGLLKGMGYRRVREGIDGEEGLKVLRSTAIDFIICDWHMPGMDGLEFLQRLRANPIWDLTAFILVSADNSEEAATAAADYGADAYVIKPIQPKLLEETIQRILSHQTTFTEVYTFFARAKALCDVEALGDALAELKGAQEKFPDNPLVWNESGQVYHMMGDEVAAERCHRQALEVNQKFLKSYDNLSALYFNQKRFAEARKALEEAIRISPRNTDRHLEVGKTYLAEGDDERAREAFHKAMAAHPKPAARHNAIAQIFMEYGRADQAIEELGLALSSEPNNLHYYNQMGIALRRQGRYLEAAQNYREALRLAPQDPVLYYNYARALLGQNDLSHAAAALRRALQFDPDFREASRALDALRQRLDGPRELTR